MPSGKRKGKGKKMKRDLDKKRGAQAALDYLVSWGWVLIVIVLVLVILFSLGIFKVPSAPTIITGFQGITMQAAQANSTMLVVELTNNYNQFVNITGITVNVNGNNYTSDSCLDTIISDGQSTLCRVPVSIPTHSYLSKIQISFTPYKSTTYEVSNGTVSSTLLSGSIPINNQLTYFLERGLPYGSTFTVNYNTSTNSTVISSIKDNVSFNLPFGKYYFSVPTVNYQGCVSVPSPSSGDHSTGGAEIISFKSNCTTTFTESGLPSGYNWQVIYNSTKNGANAPSNIQFKAEKISNVLSYSYSVTTLSNSTLGCTTTYTPSPSSGSAEAGTTTSISFSASTTCTTTFDESNLPSGYTWTVDYNSVSKSSSTSSISFPNTVSGSSIPTYSYSVTTLSNSSSSPDCTTTYTPSPSSGSAEAGTTTSISFSASEHCVTTFTESNLPSGTKWSATYDGITNSSTSNVMSFYTVPGSYSYSIKSADVNPSANSIIGSGTLPTSSGQNNGGEVFDPVNGDIYISDTFAGYVTVVGPSNNIITNIDTGIYPGAIAYDPANGDIYVADISGNQNEVIVINSSTNNIVATIGSLSFPSAIAYDPANGYMYIAEQSSGEVALINAVSNAFVTDYAVGSSPDALAYDPANGDMYVGDAGSNGEILDTSDGSTAGSTTLPVGDIQTGGLGFDPANGDMYAVNSSGEVSIIASSVVDIINTVYVGQPDITSYIIYNPTNGDMVTTGADNNFLYLINSSSNDVTYLVSSDSLDGGLVFDQANGYIYATYSNNNFIFVNSVQGKEGPDTSSGTLESGENLSVSYSRFYVVNSLNLGNGNTPAAISFNPVAGDMLVANYESGNITAITPFSNNGFYTFANIEQGANSITFDQSNSLSYVTNYDTNNVSLLNFSTNPIIAIPVPAPNNISVGSEPDGVAYNPVTGYTYVINYGSNTVSVIGYSSKYSKYMIFQNISEKSDPVDIAYDPANSDIYVSNYLSANIGVINSTGAFNLFSVSKYIADNKGPGALAFDPANGDMYVANSGSNDVSVISSASNEITSTISVGSDPSAIAYDPVNGYIYVANYESSTVSVISSSSNAVIATVPVGSGPDAIAYDPTNGYIYVANALSNTISILS